MYGNRVTEKDKFTDGMYGYTVAIDLTALNARSIVSVAASDAGLAFDPVVTPIDLITLQGYINDPDCPDLAYSLGSDILTILFNHSTLPYASTTQYTVTGYRSALPIASVTDNLDIKNRYLELFVLLSIQKAAVLLNRTLPAELKQRILELKAQIKEDNQ